MWAGWAVDLNCPSGRNKVVWTFLTLSSQGRWLHTGASAWHNNTSIINLTLQVKYQKHLKDCLLLLLEKQYLQHPVIVSGLPVMCLRGRVAIECGLTGGWAVLCHTGFFFQSQVSRAHTHISFSTLQPTDTATNKQFNMLWNVAQH